MSTPPRATVVSGSPRARNAGGGVVANPRTVDEIYQDFAGRREGMLRALATEVDQFYNLCDPERENLCLYAYPDESWEVNLPAEEVPPELPEPALGINFARDGMNKSDWISLVAVHSDAWLLAVAFYYGARFDKEKRNNLFQKINTLPTVFEVVTGKKSAKPAVKAAPAEPAVPKAKKEMKVLPKPPKEDVIAEDEEDDEDEDEQGGETLCGICSGVYGDDEFWIGCDICEKWYHGECVKITPARAESIKQYKCPSCAKKPRLS